LEAAGPILLEPWMKMDLTIPHDKMGNEIANYKCRGYTFRSDIETQGPGN